MLSYLTQRILELKKLKKGVAAMIQCRQKLLKIIRQKGQHHNIENYTSEESYQDTSMLQKAKAEIIKMCQTTRFWKEIEATNAANRVQSASSIHQLDAFLNINGVLRVGERLVKSSIQFWLQISTPYYN